jgi:prepilin-type N-terminal cleavage/methylation domain-containing protein
MMNKTKGFTLLELVVVIAVVGILSVLILFSVVQYVYKSKDASLHGYMAILISSAEVYYNATGSYKDFCSSTALLSAYDKMPDMTGTTACPAGSTPGVCCSVKNSNTGWAACAQEFVKTNLAYCVDSTGADIEICASACKDNPPLYTCVKDSCSS